jgi:acetyl-CoA C-acetyltransferase
VIQEALRRAGVRAEEVEQVIMGNAIGAGLGQNPARQAAVMSGIPFDVVSFTLNEVCGSGMKAVMVAAQMIRAGDCHIVVAGGMESMSGAPHLMRGLRWGVKFGAVCSDDAMLSDGLREAFNGYHMGITGERVAEKFGVAREEADAFALSSHMKAFAAMREGGFQDEIIPVRTGDGTLTEDECIRGDTTQEKLSALKPVFREDGILTAGNSSQLSDGAAAVVVMSSGRARELGVTALARIAGFADGGVKPEDVMEAPIPTVRRLLQKTGFAIDDFDLVEHNEAYAPASIVVARELGIPPGRLNVNGGAVALGHPIGCSGARILVTLCYALRKRGLRRGLATVCIGGGTATAMVIER